MRILKTIVKLAGKTVKWAFIVFFVYLVSLCFRVERMPGEWVERFAMRRLPEDIVFRCESLTYGLGHGIEARGLRLYDRSRREPEEPVFSAESIVLHPLGRRLKVFAACMPRLGDGYYDPGAYAEPLGDAPIGFSLPFLPNFTLELVRPSILGLEPERVEASVASRARSLRLNGVRIDWHDGGRKTSLDGHLALDLDRRRVSGEVHGLATQAQIRPLIVALDLPVALPYMDAFTDVEEPVPASCSWDVSLSDNDFRLELDLHPKLGFYNGVPMSRADGAISIHNTFPVKDGVRYMEYSVAIGPLAATDSRGRSLSGKVVARGASVPAGAGIDVDETTYLEFDAMSTLDKAAVLDIVDYLNGGALDCFECEDAPSLKVRGVLAADVARQAENDLLGSISFAKGSLFGIDLRNASGSFAYVGDKVAFFDAKAQGRDGGVVSGTAQLAFPELDPYRASFSVDVTYTGGNVGEISDMLHVDPGDRNGDVECALRLSGPIATNFASHVEGNGYIRVSKGHIAQMKLFMGLTKLLADEVPGVEKIVNQSEASASFYIKDGIVRSRDVLIEGALFSISAAGEYDITRDMLDFTVRVQLMRKDSILGKYLIRPVLWPFTKLLLEFKVTGPLDNPQWDYISVLDRML